MKQFIITLLCCAIAGNIAAQDSLDVAFVKTKHDQWQLIDRTGNVLADSLFERDSMAVFTANYHSVVFERNGKYGLKNYRNEVTIQPKYELIRLSEKKSMVVLQNGKWYILGKKWTMTPILDEQVNTSFINDNDPNCYDGYCLYEEDSAINCKAPNGNLILPKNDAFVAPWNNVFSFANNRILKYKIMANKVCSCQKLTNYYGFVDRNGKWIIEPGFEQADIFSYGLAAVSEGSENIYTYGYIDMDGKWVIDPIYKEAGRFFRTKKVD